MLSLGLLRLLALWGFVAAAWAHAWMTTVAAATVDARVIWALPLCALPWLLMHLGLQRAARRWPGRFARAGGAQLALGLGFVALAANAAAHVRPDFTIRVLREDIPPGFLPAYPLACALLPLFFSLSGRCRDLVHQALQVAVFVLAMSGAHLMLQPSAALLLAGVVLLLQLSTSGWPARFGLLRLSVLAFAAVMAAATVFGHNRSHALPSLTWILACTALMLTISLRPRTEGLWRDLLGASTCAAVAVALGGAVVMASLASAVSLPAALDTRLVLFRWHPNFLAPFFGLHAIFAVGLALTRRRSAAAWAVAALGLLLSTVLTDSRTGVAALAAGLVVLPAAFVLARIARRLPLRVVLPVLALLPLLAAGAWIARSDQPLSERLAGRLDRFEKSLDFRLDAWRNSVAIVRAHPGLGIGPQTFVSVERFAPGSHFFNEPVSPHPHDMFLYVAQSGGVPALAALAVWLAVLLRALWEAFVARNQPVPRALLAAVLGGFACVLVANLLDLGLSLETVAPAPLFLLAGLAATRCEPQFRRPRPAPGLAAALLIGALLLGLGLRPLLARAALERAQILAWQAERQTDPEPLMAQARRAAQRALELCRYTPRAHDLLARWHERQPGGFAPALELLTQLVELAPGDAASRGLRAQLLLRAGVWDEAVADLRVALDDGHGSRHQSRDRADLVFALARLGQREAALAELVEALRLDSGVMDVLNWSPAEGERRLNVAGGQPPFALSEALDQLFARHVAEHAAGEAVGHRAWSNTYRAFRAAGRADRALAVLDHLQAHGIPDVEPTTIAAERAAIALETGRLEEALAHYEHAHAISVRAELLHSIAEVRRQLGEQVVEQTVGRGALEQTGEILDRPDSFRGYLESLAEEQSSQGRPAEAAGTLERSLIFVDDVLERARRWEEIARMFLQAGETRQTERAVRAALELLASRPWPWRHLQDDHTETFPGRLARLLCRAWRQQGLDGPARQRAAWSLPSYFGARQGPALFRLGFHAANGQPDQLLREAELQLLGDPGHLPALWARLFALEASGRHHALAGAMRTLADEHARGASPERQFQQLVAVMPSRMQDPEAWYTLGVVSLLRGRYDTAPDFFRNALELLAEDSERAAEVGGWAALSEFLADRPARAREALASALARDPGDPLLALRLSVVPPEVGGDAAAEPDR